MTTLCETEQYKLEETRNRQYVVLTRKRDSADVTFEGAAARHILAEFSDIKSIRSDGAFDYWACGHAYLMTRRGQK